MDAASEISLELQPEHYGILATYGEALRNGFEDVEYTEKHLDNSGLKLWRPVVIEQSLNK